MPKNLEKPYLLVYNMNDYPDSGGGLYMDRFSTIEELDKKVNEVAANGDDIDFAGRIFEEYEYKPVQHITKMERK